MAARKIHYIADDELEIAFRFIGIEDPEKKSKEFLESVYKLRKLRAAPLEEELKK